MLLRTEGISYKYNKGDFIFEDVGLTLERGEVLSILGRNGSGKSTLLNCIAGLLKPVKGDIYLNDINTKSMSVLEIAKIISYVPQINNPSISFSILDFVVMGRTPYIGTFSKPQKKDYDIALDAMDRLGILWMKDKLYTEISGGERQQVNIARAIAQQPQIILLDEPTNHLDYGNQHRTINMIKKLSEEGYAIIMTTHNPDHAFIMDGSVAIMDNNGNLHVGVTGESLDSETLTNLYGLKILTKYDRDAGHTICVVI